MTNKLSRVWKRLEAVWKTPMTDDTTWVAHWIVVAASTAVVAGLVGLLWGHALLLALLISEAWFVFFVAREIGNHRDHRTAGHDMKRWTKDGIMDMVGPTVHHLIWWAVFLA